MEKKIQIALIASVLFLGSFVDAGSRVCKRKSIFGKIRFTCPEPGQSQDLLYCCGDDDDIGGQYCCRRNLVIGDGNFISDIGSIIGTLVGILGFILILLIICCCVCPCCLLYKRRNRGEGGRVYRTPEANVTVVPAPDIRMHQQQSMPTQPPPIGFVPQYPNPAGAYPLQQNYAPYPQPSQPYNNASTAFYPPQPPQQIYADQPPPYAGVQHEAYPKQSPYNPGF